MARALRPRTADCGPSTDTAYAPRARILECDSQSIPPPASTSPATSRRDAEGQIRSCGASHFILVQRRAHEGGQRPRRPADFNGGLAGVSRNRTEATPCPADRDVDDASEDKCIELVGGSIACAEEVDRHSDRSLALVEFEIRKTNPPRLRLTGVERRGRGSPEERERAVTPTRYSADRLDLQVMGVRIMKRL